MAEETKKPSTAKAAPKAAKPAAPKAEKPAAEKPAAAPKAAKPAEAKKSEFKLPEPKNRLEKKYRNEIVPELVKEFGYSTVMMAPKLDKIVVNMGVGDATSNSKVLDDAVNDLTILSGQKPIITKAKKSIANFKLREGQAIGCKVTLRGERMYEFLDKLVSIALPRVRDFRGISKNAFDGHGNYTLGVKEQLIFPEIDYDKVGKVRGMDIIIVTTANTDEEARELLTLMGAPFAR